MGRAPGVDAGNETMTSPWKVVCIASSPEPQNDVCRPSVKIISILSAERARRLDVDLDPFDGLVPGAVERALEEDARALSLGKARADDLEPVADFGFAGGKIEDVEELRRCLGRNAPCQQQNERQKEGQKPHGSALLIDRRFEKVEYQGI